MLVVAPSWVGDAILSEPLVALLREPLRGTRSSTCSRRRGARRSTRACAASRRIIENPFGHGKLALRARRTAGARAVARAATRARSCCPTRGSRRSIPWLARIPRRIGYVGEARWGLLTDARSARPQGAAAAGHRYAALAGAPGALIPMPPRAGARARRGKPRRGDARAAADARDRPVAILCPGAEYGPAKRWPAEHFADAGAAVPRRRLCGLDRRLAQRHARRGRADQAARRRPRRCATSPAAPTSARRSICCRSRRSSSATIPD